MLILITLVADIFLIILHGLSLSTFWDWFVYQPELLGLPAITVAQAIGLVFIVTFLTYRVTRKPDDVDINTYIAQNVLGRFLALGVFWVLALILHFIII